MSKTHKHATISFHIPDNYRREIDAKAKASGMLKKDYFIRSCIYNKVCVVGKKETVYELVKCVRQMQEDMHVLADEIALEGQIRKKKSPVDGKEYDEIEELKIDYLAMLNAIIDFLDGAKYLWEPEETKQPHV